MIITFPGRVFSRLAPARRLETPFRPASNSVDRPNHHKWLMHSRAKGCKLKNDPLGASQCLYAWTFERSVPPHPGPLPRGEGARFANARALTLKVEDVHATEKRAVHANATRAQKLGMLLPLPEGEGRGEGEESVQVIDQHTETEMRPPSVLFRHCDSRKQFVI